MSQPIIDDPLEKDAVKPEHDRAQQWTMVTLGMAIALLGNNLRIIYDPFPAYFLDWNGIQIETDASIHFLIFTLGMVYFARKVLQNEPDFLIARGVWLSFISGFFAIVLFQSVDVFVTYSISGIWRSLLRSAIMMGAYCSVVCYIYFAFKKRGTLGIAIGALMAWVAFSWVLLHYWKV